MYNSTKAKWNSHAVRWCTFHTAFRVSMERVFGVTVGTWNLPGAVGILRDHAEELPLHWSQP